MILIRGGMVCRDWDFVQRQIALVSHGNLLDDGLFSHIIRAYGHFGQIDLLNSVFANMYTRKLSPRLPHYQAIIEEYLKLGDFEAASKMLEQSQKKLIQVNSKRLLKLLENLPPNPKTELIKEKLQATKS